MTADAGPHGHGWAASAGKIDGMAKLTGRPGGWIRILKRRLFAAAASCLAAGSTAWAGQSVSLTWDASVDSGIAGYALYLGSHSGNYSSRLDVGLTTVVTLNGLTAGQTEYFVVHAYGASRLEGPPSNEASFFVPVNGQQAPLFAPQITGLSPGSAPVGGQVFIYGANFSSINTVLFGGLNASFIVSSDRLVIATVPPGAASGVLSVTGTAGAATRQFTVASGVAPANDSFSTAQILTGNTAVATAATGSATRQAGEPNHAGNAGGHSVWYRWTAPANGTWSLDTGGSDFNALLAVYSGAGLNGLSVVASNGLSGGALTTALTFNATAGVTYQIAVDGQNGAAGNALLRLLPAIPATFTVYSTSFEPADGFVTGSSVGNGWVKSGSGGKGIVSNYFVNAGQQAYLGYSTSTPATETTLTHPLNFAMDTNISPVIQFSVVMKLSNLLGSYNDVLAWVVRNAAGQELFRVSFDNGSKFISYRLDNGAGPVPTQFYFDNFSPFNFSITMDFARNRWSAWQNGVALAAEQPITTVGTALTLGDIAADEVFSNPTGVSFDGMLFDDYAVTAGPEPLPAIVTGLQNKTVAATSDLVLGVIASGAPPLSYQWYYGGMTIPNATNAGLVLKNIVTNQGGSYSVVVANGAGSASSSAVVTVTSQPAKAQFAAPVFAGTGGPLLNLALTAGYNYRFQASTNLADWSTLWTFYAAGTNVACFDPAAPSFSRRFYRVVTP
jgi:hypothetical protein